MNNTSPKNLFCEKRKYMNDLRAQNINKPDADFLVREAAQTIAERLAVTNREFPVALDLFSSTDAIQELLAESGKVTEITAINSNSSSKNKGKKATSTRDHIIAGEQYINLVTSIFGLHWSNNLPAVFKQIRTILQEDGLFMAALPGDKTLSELRDCLILAETQLTGNASLRIDPFGEVRQYGNLLQKAGFTLPVVDTDLLCVRYSDMFGLIDDLRAMGATSCLLQRPQTAPRDLFKLASEFYNEKYADPDGKIRATFEIVYLSGWAPHHSQQKPLKPGSAKHKLSDFI